MKDEELVEMKTDIALIKADVKNIQKFFAKVETSIEMMTELSRNSAVQAEQLKNTIDKLEDLDNIVIEHRKEDVERSRIVMERLEAYRNNAYNDHQRLADHTAQKRLDHNKMLIDEIREIKEAMNTRLDEQDEAIQDLQRWKYYAMGGVGVFMFILVEMNWQLMFG
jgi:hypothetical protein